MAAMVGAAMAADDALLEDLGQHRLMAAAATVSGQEALS